MTWGCDAYGGDSSHVQAQLQNVHQIQATLRAFAAILGDGSVVTWTGAESFFDFGGNRTAVRHKLKSVQQIQATDFSFAQWRWIGRDLGPWLAG